MEINPLTQPGGHSPDHAPSQGAHLIPAPMPEVGRDPEVAAREAARFLEPEQPKKPGDYKAGEVSPEQATARDRAILGAQYDREQAAATADARDAEIDRRIKAVTGAAE